MSSQRRKRERAYFRKLAQGHTCPGCGLAAAAVEVSERERYWYQPHLEDCPSLADPGGGSKVADSRPGRPLQSPFLSPGFFSRSEPESPPSERETEAPDGRGEASC